jgi:hypothetical protein
MNKIKPYEVDVVDNKGKLIYSATVKCCSAKDAKRIVEQHEEAYYEIASDKGFVLLDSNFAGDHRVLLPKPKRSTHESPNRLRRVRGS